MQNKHENDEKFLFCMAALAEATGQEATPMKIKIYAKALEDIPAVDIEKACWHLIRTRGTATFPKVAEIREAICGKPEDAAQLALRKVEEGMRRYGYYDSVCFDDPIIHAVIVGMGGWEHICEIPEDEWKFTRKDFEKSYLALSRTHPAHMEIPPRLAGFHERGNSAQGFNRPVQVKYIGDKTAAVEWSGKVQQDVKQIEMRQRGEGGLMQMLKGIVKK